MNIDLFIRRLLRMSKQAKTAKPNCVVFRVNESGQSPTEVLPSQQESQS